MTRPFVLLALAIMPLASFAQVLIKNVNVVDVEKKSILKGYDVAVIDGKIISVAKGIKLKMPPGTVVVEGAGRYLARFTPVTLP